MTEAGHEHQLWRDPIVAEVRRIREDFFAAAGRDIREFFRRLHEKQARSGHRVVTRAPRGARYARRGRVSRTFQDELAIERSATR